MAIERSMAANSEEWPAALHQIAVREPDVWMTSESRIRLWPSQLAQTRMG